MEDFLSTYLQYMRQPAFWWGGISLLAFTFFLLWLVGRMMAAWNTVNQFFSPTRGADPNKPGPSPFARLTGCLLSILFLLAVLVFLTVAIFTMFRM
jgi:hypothetical protein